MDRQKTAYQIENVFSLLSNFSKAGSKSGLLFTEGLILEKAYSEDYTYPAGFYHEINNAGSSYYENTVSIRPLSERDHI